MSDEPIAQVDIEREIVRLSGLLEKATHAVRTRGQELAHARTAFKVAYAKALLVAEGTVPVREAEATVATEEVFLAYQLAEALLESAKEGGRNMREQLGSLRTLAANQRALVVGG